MLNRFFSLAVPVCIAASMAVLAQTGATGAQGEEYLFQYPGVSTSGQFVPYNAAGNPLAPLINNASGPAGIESILPMPDGSKLYLIGALSIEAVDPTFQNFHGVTLSEPSGLTPTVTAAKLTPDGKYLLVGTIDSSNVPYLFVVPTSTDQQLSQSGMPIQLKGVPGPYSSASPPCPGCWIEVSRDASTAYVIENSTFGGNTLVAAYSMTSFQPVQTPLSISGSANSLTLSPANLLYFVGGNQIQVIDPIAWAIVASVPLSGFNPGPLVFTPDGTTAYSIHQIPRQGGSASLLSFNVANNSVNWYSPPVNQLQAGPQLSAVYVAGNSNCPSARCVFALSATQTTLYDVSPSTGFSAGSPSPTVASAVYSAAATNVVAATISNEVPASNYLFVLVANGSQPFLDRISIAADQVSVSNLQPVLSTGLMQFVSIPTQGTAASFITFNASQTVNTGTTSLPLIARAIGPTGLPVFNTAGTFSAVSGSGVVVNTPNVTSTADGYVLTTVTIPSTGVTCPSNVCTITLSLGGNTAAFTITVPGASSPTGPSGPSSSEVTITGGNGQVVQAGYSTVQPLQVTVTNASGVPQSGVPVTFAVTSGTGQVYPGTQETDVNGNAQAYYAGGQVAGGQVFETDTVVASTSLGSVTFYETSYTVQYVFNVPEGGLQASVLVLDPAGQYVGLAGTTVQVSPGTPAKNALQATILGNPYNGNPSTGVPDVSISTQTDPAYGTGPPPVSCQGQPLSDITGTVYCTLVTSCSASPGVQGVQILLGGQVVTQDLTVDVVLGGGPATITATSGNNQSGNPGQRATLPLLATVTNSCGTPEPEISVTWTVTSGSATLQQSTTTSNSFGQVSNVVTYGNTPGTVIITATAAGGGSATFTLTSTVAITGLTTVSGGGQTATAGQAFAKPLIVSVVGTNNTPLAGIPVTFTVTSGSATVNPASANSGSNGQAQTTVTAGSNAGPVVVTASITGFSQTFNLTVIPPGPSVTASSFVNAASNATGLVACGLGVVTGSGLAAGIQGVISGSNGFGPLPYTLAGVSMTINGVAVPIEAVSNQNGVQQVNFQTPCETAGSTSATVVLTVSGASTTIPGVQVFQAQPGIFTYAGPNNLPYAVVINAQNGTYVTPSNPAIRGGTYYVVLTGLGQTNPPMTTNSVSVAGQNVVPIMVVGVNNSGVPVISAAAYVDTFGAYLVGFQLPTTASPGTNVPFSVAADLAGTLIFSNSTYLAAVQ